MSGLFDTIVTILLFIIVLGGLVLFHEFGHFVTARLARVRVLEFGIGFPPRAKVLAQDGETMVTLNWLPIGGFVRLEGEDGDEGDDPRSFVRARLPIKMFILIAGVGMNLLLAFSIFTGIAWVATPYVGLKFASVEAGSPAEAAGIRADDAIVSVDGQRFDFFSSYDDASIIDALRSHAGQTVAIGLVRADGTSTEVNAALRTQAEIAAGKGALGIRAGDKSFETLFLPEYTGRPLGTAASIGASETTRWFGLILSGLGNLVGSIAKDPTAPPPVSGPVGIATSLGDVFRGSGAIMTLYVAGILSANLALVNFLPFPPLDGGRMVVILLKAIPRYGTRISLRAERLTYAVGFIVLFSFLVWITVFDVVRQVGGGSP
jgi:regulator of sigma E protease